MPNKNTFLNPNTNTAYSYSPIPTSSQAEKGVVQQQIPAEQPETIITSAPSLKNSGARKVIATIFSLLVLIGGLTAGVSLVQKQQEIEERADSGKGCQEHADCILLDQPGNAGFYTAPRPITHILIFAEEVKSYGPGETNDGCYNLTMKDDNLSWKKISNESFCRDIINIHVWLSAWDTPRATKAKCNDIKVYDKNWKIISQNDLNNLGPGNIIRFGLECSTTSGLFEKVRFSINGELVGETTNKKPNSNEFYIEYTIPNEAGVFNVKAEVHHSELGWF